MAHNGSGLCKEALHPKIFNSQGFFVIALVNGLFIFSFWGGC